LWWEAVLCIRSCFLLANCAGRVALGGDALELLAAGSGSGSGSGSGGTTGLGGAAGAAGAGGTGGAVAVGGDSSLPAGSLGSFGSTSAPPPATHCCMSRAGASIRSAPQRCANSRRPKWVAPYASYSCM